MEASRNHVTKTRPHNNHAIKRCDRVVVVGDLIGYARVSTADQNPQMQLDALSAENCLKTYTDTATGTKAALRGSG